MEDAAVSKDAYQREARHLREIANQYVAMLAWADADAIEINFRINLALNAMREASQRLPTHSGPRRAPGRFGVLRALAFAPEHRLSQTEIGEHMHLAPPNVTYLVDGLEKDGLVARLPNAMDRRITWVELTAEGDELCSHLIPEMTAHMGELVADFSPEEKRQFSDFLARLQHNAEASQRDV